MSFKVKFNDLLLEHKQIDKELKKKLNKIFNISAFIGGDEIIKLEKSLSKLLNVKNVITCNSGTDALQIALMSLNLKKGDEVIIPSFSYISAIEVVALLGLTPRLIDIDSNTFNIDINELENAITSKTKVVIPVHLFGQNSNMHKIISIAKKYKIKIIEDSAQSINSKYRINKKIFKSGTMGDIGCISFFPTKNLGCYGDGGAILTNNNKLAKKIRMIKNHGQSKKYIHDMIGVNSRLDNIQATIINLKLKYFENNNSNRKKIADIYFESLNNIKEINLPKTEKYSEHIYHQFTIIVKNGKRDALKKKLDNDKY